ncbi:MAG: DsbA family protein [Halobacteriales archaeon]
MDETSCSAMERRRFFALIGASLVGGCAGGGQETDTPEPSQSLPSASPSTPVVTEQTTETAGVEESTTSAVVTDQRTTGPGDRTTQQATETAVLTETPDDLLPPPTMGDPDADVTVTVFEDFACPHCRDFSLEVVPDLKTNYVDPGSVLYQHRDFPLPVNQWSRPAANAARAVQDLSDDTSFFEYARKLYENQSRYSLDLFLALGDGVGVDGAVVRTAAGERRYESVIQSDVALGNEMGVRGTPEVYVNGSRTENPAYETVQQAIESKL